MSVSDFKFVISSIYYILSWDFNILGFNISLFDCFVGTAVLGLIFDFIKRILE